MKNNSDEVIVSIIMPSYNSSMFIIQSIESVLKQTFPKWELIITDDCSTDNTFDLISQYASIDSRIKVFRNKDNLGAGVARNNSIKNANGRFIAFLDSDDMWHPTKLEKQIPFMINKNCALSYSYYQKMDENGQLLSNISPPITTSSKKLLFTNVIGCLTAIYDTEKVGKLYMPSIRKRQDMALWIKIMDISGKAYAIPETLAYYRISKNSLSGNKYKAAKSQWYLYRNVLNLSLIRSMTYFTSYAFFGFLKNIK
ncbi:glycosyltransferase family 2 protein [Photorhabdus bodei]|uniref:glycosyltransferase family 2 protein n=1 Tax=Photorhabdus bodei TaxID=2029681 RepID=UPI001E4E5237|nr:glycosyltransferase [Photorhabdus bodei]MCC8466949.1 glycosyltransferase [Photorhabdus bodei]MDB6367018.1 glycosyltransferase [Photorhabdus bodei]